MTAAALALALVSLGHPSRNASDLTRARILAAQIVRAAEPWGLDPVLVASIIARESSFDRLAVGADGKDLGLLQIRRGGAVVGSNEHLTDAALMSPPINLAIGVSYLAKVRAECARKGIGDPAAWISRYKGLPARPSRYSRGIIAAAARARVAIARAERGSRVGLGTAPARAHEVAAR